MTRISIPLDEQEEAILLNVSSTQCRHPREQARYWMRQGMIQDGVLDRNKFQQTTQHQQPAPAVQGAG